MPAEARRLHPAGLASRALKFIPQAVLGGAGYAAVIANEGMRQILIFAGLGLILAAVAALLSWWRFTYRVGEREMVIESGVLSRQRRVIPFDRVQDVAIERGVLARLFGTARVRVETGGSASDEGDLDMIALADAQALRDHIRRVHGAADMGPSEAEREAEPLIYAMDLPRVALSGLFNFSLLFLAGIFAVLQYLQEFGLIDPMEWVTEEAADRAASGLTLQIALGLAAILLLLGMVTGLVRTIAKDFGFRLTRSEAGLRRRRGLFTLSEVVIPLPRTQVAVIDSGMVARLLGFHRLSFQTLGADRRERGVQVVAPFATGEETARVLAEAGFPQPPPRAHFRRAPRRAIFHLILVPVLLATGFSAAAFALEPQLGLAASALVLVAVAMALRWRKHLYALGETALFVRSGFLSRRMLIVPFEKLQTLRRSAGPVQRALRLTSLSVDTAGAPIARPVRMIDLDPADADWLAGELVGLFHERRAALRGRNSDLATSDEQGRNE